MRPKLFIPEAYAKGLMRLGFTPEDLHIVTPGEVIAIDLKPKPMVERRAHGALRGRLNFEVFLEERKGITHEQLMELPAEEQEEVRAEYAALGLQWFARYGEQSA